MTSAEDILANFGQNLLKKVQNTMGMSPEVLRKATQSGTPSPLKGHGVLKKQSTIRLYDPVAKHYGKFDKMQEKFEKLGNSDKKLRSMKS